MALRAAALKRLGRVLGAATLLLCGLWLLYALGLGLAVLGAAALFALVITLIVPRMGERAIEHAGLLWRAWIWRHEEGHHHEFGGVALHIEDDGRHLWLAAEDLQRVLRLNEPEDAFAARHSERWQRDAKGQLWLRLDAVVERLASMPGRDAPRNNRLRLYFEREVLFPAAERRRRAR